MTLLSLCAVKPLVTSGFPLQDQLYFGGPVCGDSIASGFLAQKLDLICHFVFALTSCLTNSRFASELKSKDAYAMPLLCVICQSDIPHG